MSRLRRASPLWGGRKMRSIFRVGGLPHVVTVLLAIFLAAPAIAHDIPNDVTVQAFVKPDGHSLRVVMRLPLKAVMDVEFPRREREFLDLPKMEPSLRDAARLALLDNLEIYEGERPLLNPR